MQRLKIRHRESLSSRIVNANYPASRELQIKSLKNGAPCNSAISLLGRSFCLNSAQPHPRHPPSHRPPQHTPKHRITPEVRLHHHPRHRTPTSQHDKQPTPPRRQICQHRRRRKRQRRMPRRPRQIPPIMKAPQKLPLIRSIRLNRPTPPPRHPNQRPHQPRRPRPRQQHPSRLPPAPIIKTNPHDQHHRQVRLPQIPKQPPHLLRPIIKPRLHHPVHHTRHRRIHPIIKRAPPGIRFPRMRRLVLRPPIRILIPHKPPRRPPRKRIHRRIVEQQNPLHQDERHPQPRPCPYPPLHALAKLWLSQSHEFVIITEPRVLCVSLPPRA